MTVVNINEFDSYRFSLLEAKIGQVKSSFDHLITNTYEYLKGSRYKDNNRIARFILGEIYTECGFDSKKANQKFLSLNSEEMMPYIQKGVLDAASADYYYTYEKQF